MKKTIRTLSLISATLIASTLALSACKKGEVLGNYVPNFDQNTLKTECDADMKIDGVLDEVRWQNLDWLSHHDNASDSYFRCTTSFSDKGVYIAAIVEDWRMYYTAPYSNTKNTNVEISLARVDDASLNDRVYISFTCGGTIYAHGLYAYLGAVTVQGAEINTGESDGMTVEAFVPWTQLGLTEKPEAIKMVGLYRYMESMSGTVAAVDPGYVNVSTYGKYYDFGTTGFLAMDGAGELGDSKSGFAKGPDWDMTRADENIFKSNKQGGLSSTGQTYIFFRKVQSANYSVSATFTPNIAAGATHPGIKSASPKAGLMTGYLHNKCFYALMIDYNATNISEGRLVLTSSVTEGNSTNHDNVVYRSQKGAFDLTGPINLTCVKNGLRFYYYVNGEFVAQEDIEKLRDAAEPGIQTTNCDVTVTDAEAKYYQTAGDAGVREYLNSTGIYMVDVETGSGGAVTPEAYSVEEGKSLILNVTPSNGFFQLKTLDLRYDGDTEWTHYADEAKSDMVQGKFTIPNIRKNVTVKYEFEYKAENIVTVSGSVKAGSANIQGATVAVEGETDKSLYYTTTTTATGAYSIRVPAGNYKIYVKAQGYEATEGTITASVGTGGSKSFQLSTAIIGGSVTLNGKTITSDTSRADMTRANEGIVTFSTSGGATNAVWFGRDGAITGDFTVSAVYTYNFGTDVDPSGGFIISDGNSDNDYALYAIGKTSTGQAGARFYHVAAGEWANRYNMRKDSLGIFYMNEETEEVIVTLKRKDGTYYLYADTYSAGMTEATTLRGQIDGGDTHAGKIASYTDNGRTVPKGTIAIGLSVKDKSSYTVRVIGELKKSATV